MLSLGGFLTKIFQNYVWLDGVEQCFSTFLLPRNPEQPWRLLTEPHALICAFSDVREVEARGCHRLISLAGHSPCEDDKQAKMTNVKFDRINRQQYVIVFNVTRRARRSTTAS